MHWSGPSSDERFHLKNLDELDRNYQIEACRGVHRSRSKSIPNKISPYFSESFSVQSGIMPRPTKSRCNHFCPTPGDLDHPATFDLLITPTDLQRRAFGLIDQITV
jgi:hypothetical protein